MVVFCIIKEQRLNFVQIEKHVDLKPLQFYGNTEHLLSNKHLYHVVGDVIELNPNYDTEMQNLKAFVNLNIIREKRKPLLQAFDTLELKRKFILDGFISQGEFPFIDSMTEERWLEIKVWRDQLRTLPDGDLLNYVFPETPEEVSKFL